MNEQKNQVELLLSDISKINEAAKAEKRSFTAEEKSAIETKKAAIADLKSKIEVDSYVNEEARESARKAFEKKEVAKREYSVGRAIKLAISGKPLDGVELEVEQEAEKFLKERGMTRQHPNSILIPASMIEQRATNSVSNQSSLIRTNILDSIGMVQYPVIYNQIATVWNDVPNGNFAIPSMQNIIASYATTDSTATDLALTSAVKILTPKWMQATGAFTKDFLASSTESMQDQVFGFFQYAIDRATDKQLLNDVSTATTAQVYVSTATTKTYQGVLKLINGIPYATAFLSSKRGATFLQTTPTISGSSTNALPILNAANQIAGINAYSSFDAPNGLYAVGDFSNYHVVFWKNGVYELLVDPYTEARKGNIIMQVSRLQNQGVGNPAAFAIATQGGFI
jgi:Phage capsid family